MNFFIFTFLAFFTVISGQWPASVIPMVPNSHQFNGRGPQGPENQENPPPYNPYSQNRAVYPPQRPPSGPLAPIQPTNQFFGQQPFIPVSQLPVNQFSGFSGAGYQPSNNFGQLPDNYGSRQFLRSSPQIQGVSQFVPESTGYAGYSGFSRNVDSSMTPSHPPQVGKGQKEQVPSSGSLPKFLEGADQITVKEFKRIIRQPNVTYENKIKQVDELISTLDDSKQLLYQKFMKESDDLQEQNRDKIHKTVSAMSPDAQKIFAKISAILTNPNMPEEERWSRILMIYGNVDKNLRDEFEKKFEPNV